MRDLLHCRALLRCLQNSPEVQIIHDCVEEGASDEQLDSIEERLGCRLHPIVRNFYKMHNGVFIQWISKHNPAYDPNPSQYEFPPQLLSLLRAETDCLPHSDGFLVVFPVQEVFVDSIHPSQPLTDYGSDDGFFEYLDPYNYQDDFDTKEPITFLGKKYSSRNEVRQCLRFFDYSMPDRGALMLYERGVGDPTVIYTDRWDTLQESPPRLKLSEYICRLYTDFGLIWKRDEWFHSPSEITFNNCGPHTLSMFDEEDNFGQVMQECKSYFGA